MRDAEEKLPLLQIFDEVCRTVDAGGDDIAFANIESSMYKRSRTAMPSLSTNPRDADAPITAVDLCRWEIRSSTAVQWTMATMTQLWSYQRGTARATTFVPSGVRRRHFSGGAFDILSLQLFTVFVQHTDHSFPVTHSTMTRKTTALYQSVFEKLHALIVR